jgi:hypothetical protein
MDDLNPLPEPTNDLERRAKEEMDGDGYRHWMLCRAAGACPACGKAIEDGDKLRRGIHQSCYQLTYRYYREGHWTLEERVREGRIDPMGRPPHPLTLEVRRLSE